MTDTDIAPIRAFLGCDTPDTWVDAALDSLDTLLIDHANCEKKAAGTALNMLFFISVWPVTAPDRRSPIARGNCRRRSGR